MSLDVRILSDLAPTETTTPEGIGWGRFVNVQHEFAARAAPYAVGWYSCAETGRFGAGSYTDYNDWREWLATLAGYAAVGKNEEAAHPHAAYCWRHTTEGPFWELINFTDCDGVLGSEACAKLAGDFAAWDERARSTGDEWDYRMFRQFRAAVEAGSKPGAAVEFC